MTDPIIVIDTQEKKPWVFGEWDTVRASLRTGDYSLVGLEQSVVIERKSLGDLVSTLIHDWIRFRKELTRLAGYDLAVIAVEATVGDVLAKRYEGDANPQSVIAKCHTCLIDHGVSVQFWGPAEEAQVVAYRLLNLAWKRYG